MIEVEEEVYVLPVSSAQRRLWFVDRMEPGSPLYNVPAAWRLRGPLDPAELEAALNGILARHEVLRTTFEVENGEPVQVVRPHQPRPLPLIEVSAFIEEELRAEAARPFDLDRGPLFRALLLRRAPDDHVLLVTFHHIVSDGRSLALFGRELSALYQSSSALLDLPIQYADFAAWQRDWLAGGEMEAQLAWWRERLADAPPVQEIPMAGPRPAVRSHRGAWRLRALPAVPAVEELGRREGASPFVALLAAFQALLFRLTPYSGRTDVIVGTPIDNRAGEETERLMGLFVNTLALRTDFAGDPTFREVLGRVRRVALEAYAHQDLPFERLVEELRPERDLNHDPVVQVVFGIQDGADPLHLAGLDVEPLEVHHGQVKLDLAMTVERGRGARIDYDADLFDAAAVDRLLDSFAALIEGAAENPDLLISDLPVLNETQRRQVLLDWNVTHEDPKPGPAAIHEWFEAWAERTPEAPALIAEDGTFSYAELDARANRLAHHLMESGVGPETRVAIVMRHSPNRIVALLAVLKAGGVYVSLDPLDPPERRASILEDCGAEVVIEALPELDACPSIRPAIRVEGEQLAYVIYTSGSTGRPKGVEVPHRGLVNLVRWHRRIYGVALDDRAPQMAGEGFDASVWELWPYLASGAAVVFPPGEARGNPAKLVPWLADAGITLCFLPTPVAELALDEPWPEDLRLRALLVGGDRLRRRPDGRHRFRLVNHYGPTESSVVATWGDVAPEGSTAPPIGRPIDRTRVYVLDRSGVPVPAGVAGELCLGGESLARGYLGRPDLTAERFVPAEEGHRLYRTGDLVRHRADGEIEFLGRIDHQVKIRGVRIELGEIEAVLAQHPEVRESVVTVREQGAEKRLVAYVKAESREGEAESRVLEAKSREVGPNFRDLFASTREGFKESRDLAAESRDGVMESRDPNAESRETAMETGDLAMESRNLVTKSRKGVTESRDPVKDTQDLVAGSRVPVATSRDRALEARLGAFLAARLPAAMVPSAVVFLDALPLTPNGKVDLRALPEPDWDGAASAGFAAAGTPSEELLTEIWSELLHRPAIGIHDGFFDLGGHSLLATQVVSRIRLVFGVELPLRAVFEAPTVAGLAERVEVARKGGTAPVPTILPIPRGGEI
ncbi:MAG TPA: amino acid adenylation domain-containing protein, partial [Thermoanaerobaculia bacterium]|nr:amino acid adenylation domain-containing protein [Thermoanaerobaculia bacterium]